MSVEPHRQLMIDAIEHDAAAQRALLAGDGDTAAAEFAAAASGYRASWELAPPKSYGRLIGMLKSAVLAGSATEQAQYVASVLTDEDGDQSAAASYARAIAALVLGDDEGALRAAARMRGGSDAFDRTAAAIAALASRDRKAYTEALGEIVADFEQRSEHLTGVAIADTAAMLERLAAPRELGAGISSALLA